MPSIRVWHLEFQFNGHWVTKSVCRFVENSYPSFIAELALLQVLKEGKLVVGLCEGIAKDKAALDDSTPIPLVESDEDLQDLIDLREEVTGGDFEVIYRDSFTDRD